jgi:hypothetical protein
MAQVVPVSELDTSEPHPEVVEGSHPKQTLERTVDVDPVAIVTEDDAARIDVEVRHRDHRRVLLPNCVEHNAIILLDLLVLENLELTNECG